MRDRPLVSVIVPTFNSETYLEKCLKSIRAQTYPKLEVITVDNYSTDGTRKIARRYADLILLKGKERSEQVNFGVRHARGKYVYRVDSDFVLEPTVVEEAVNLCETKGYDAIIIHNTSDPSVSFWAKVRKFERDFYRNDEFNVAARFLRKDVFEAIGGFDESLIAAEDYDLHNRLLTMSFKIGTIKAKEIHIGEPKSLAEVVRKHYYYGKTISSYIRKNPERAKKQLNPFRIGFLRNLPLFLKNPELAFGLAVYQFTRYFAAGVGFLSCKVAR